ncbi:DNA replication complex subunit Gins51 [Halobellus rufus]|uniref:DNA replication complex subunit Gins51 n=1 Tax=Halobellus rufus TaxID=1448860 RepID=UPI00067875E8|nr:hypothetical protein [Halobellus rufus]
MDLEELRSVRRTERQKDSLQHLRDSFYEDVAAYIAERKAERRRAADAAEDPFDDPDVGRLTDEIETAEDVVESIYERRVGKVVKLASFAAADMSADTDGLTAEERDLFEGLVGRIKQNRQTVLDVLAGEGGSEGDDRAPPAETDHGTTSAAVGSSNADASPSTEADSIAATDAPSAEAAAAPTDEPAGSDDVLADAMGGPDDGGAAEPASDAADADPDVPPDVPPDAPPDASAPDAPVVESADAAEAEQASEETDRVTLRITEDVGQIFGVDEREYDLESEDVVTLPTTNAGPLLERDAAEQLD